MAGCDYIIRTAAVHDNNPEIVAAHAKGIPVFERAQAWGAIMQQYKNAVCISGTHGKTTTTSMMTHITMAAALDPTIMVGGTLPLLGSGYRVGHGRHHCPGILRILQLLSLTSSPPWRSFSMWRPTTWTFSRICTTSSTPSIALHSWCLQTASVYCQR